MSSQFHLVEKGLYINAPSPFVTSGNRYILGVLNSSLADYDIRSRGVTRNGGYFEYKPMFIEKFPIPKIPQSKQKPFEILVNLILFSMEHGLETEAETFESVIDGMVYDLYFAEEMKKANCYIIDRITEVIEPFEDNETDKEKTEYIKKFYEFCRKDKTVFHGLIHRRTIKVVRIITGEE